MTWFERVMCRFGWVRADALAVQKLNAEFAFAKSGRLEPAFEALREDHAVTVDVRARELSMMRVRAGELVGDV